MKRNILFCITFLFLVSFRIHAQTLSDELRAASSITNPTDRLNVYDKILEKYNIRETAQTTDTGKWTIDVNADPITDEKVITFVLEAASGLGIYGDPVNLVVRWSKGTTEMYINWNSYLGQKIDVTFRIGDGAPETKNWNLSADSRASLYPGNPLQIVQNILNNTQIIARCTPINESPITAIFDVAGLKIIAAPYNNDLKWY